MSIPTVCPVGVGPIPATAVCGAPVTHLVVDDSCGEISATCAHHALDAGGTADLRLADGCSFRVFGTSD